MRRRRVRQARLPCPDLAEFLDDVGAEILVGAHDLQLRLADLGLGFGNRRDQLARARHRCVPPRAAAPSAAAAAPGACRRRSCTPTSSPAISSSCLAFEPTWASRPAISSLSWRCGCAAAPSGSRGPLARAWNSVDSAASRFFTAVLRFAARVVGKVGPCEAVAFRDQPGAAGAEFVELLGDHLQAGLRLCRISRSSRSPALTRMPLRTGISATTPPLGCWIALTFDCTTRLPGTTTAPASGTSVAQPPASTRGHDQHAQARPSVRAHSACAVEARLSPARAGSSGDEPGRQRRCGTVADRVARPSRGYRGPAGLAALSRGASVRSGAVGRRSQDFRPRPRNVHGAGSIDRAIGGRRPCDPPAWVGVVEARPAAGCAWWRRRPMRTGCVGARRRRLASSIRTAQGQLDDAAHPALFLRRAAGAGRRRAGPPRSGRRGGAAASFQLSRSNAWRSRCSSRIRGFVLGPDVARRPRVRRAAPAHRHRVAMNRS